MIAVFELPLLRAVVVSLTRAMGRTSARCTLSLRRPSAEWLRLLPHAGCVTAMSRADRHLRTKLRRPRGTRRTRSASPSSCWRPPDRDGKCSAPGTLARCPRRRRSPGMAPLAVLTWPPGELSRRRSHVSDSRDGDGGLARRQLRQIGPCSSAVARRTRSRYAQAQQFALTPEPAGKLARRTRGEDALAPA